MAVTKKQLQDRYLTFMERFASDARLGNNAIAKDYGEKLSRDAITAEKLHDQRTQTKTKRK